MASHAIGSASVVLSANADPLASGLNKAAGDVQRWAARTEKTATAAASGKGGLVSALLTGGKMAAGVAVAAVGASLAAIPAEVDALKELAEAGKKADSLGIGSDRYMGLAAAIKKVGIEGDATGAVLAKLGKKSADAAAGHGEAAAKFAQLGLNAAEIAKLPLDQQFGRVADAIAKLPPGGQQAAAALGLFEEAGAKLLPVLAKGSAGIEEQIQKAKRLGLALDPQKMARVQQAAAAVPRFGAVLEGAKNKLLVAMAPGIEAWGGLLERVFERITPAIDYWARVCESFYSIFGALGNEAIDLITDVVDQVANWTAGFLGLNDTSITVSDAVFGLFRGIGTGAAYAWDTIKTGAGAMSLVAGSIVADLGRIVDAFKSTIKDAFELAGKLPDSLGGKWFRDHVNDVDGLGKNIEAAGEKMKAWGKGAIEGFGGSAAQVDRWFDKIEAKFKAGIGENAAALADMAAGSVPVKLGGALDVNSKEAYSITTKYQTQQAIDNADADGRKRQLRAAEDAVKIARDTLDVLKERLNFAAL